MRHRNSNDLHAPGRLQWHNARWRGAVLTLGAVLVLLGPAEAAPEVCGEPRIDSNPGTALRIWKNCSSGTWTMSGSAAFGADPVVYQGTVSSDQAATLVATKGFERSDILDSSNSRELDFQFTVVNGGADELSFNYPASADVCLRINSPNAEILVGPNATALASPVNLRTMGPCDSSACGSISYQKATQNGAFVWQDCNSNRWHLRITGGGSSSYRLYRGSVASNRAISNVSPVSVETNDTLDTSQSKQIEFDLTVGGNYEDGFDFTLEPGATTCLDTGTTTALVGPNRIAVQSPFDVVTLQPCANGSTTAGDVVGVSSTEIPTPSGVSYQLVRPKVLSSVVELANPGRGFEQAGKILNNGQISYNSAVENHSDITYIRLPWANLEPNRDNQWNWSDLDRAINDAVRRGKQAAISVISWKPILDNYNYQDAVPTWYSSSPRHVRCTDANVPAGCTYYRVDANVTCQGNGATCRNRWAFNHDDPVFIDEQVELINALRQRYDNKAWAEKIAYIDVRSIGSWSESHTTAVTLVGKTTRWPMPKWANYKRIIDAHLAFQYIPQIVNFDNDDQYRERDGTHPWDYACRMAQLGGQTIGWRTDGIESTDWEIDKVWEWSDAARDCWKTGPVYAEAMHGMGLQSGDLLEGLQRLTDWRASGWNNKYSREFPNNNSYTYAVDDWLTQAGYRLYFPQAKIPSVALANQPFQVDVQLANSGLAPFYRNFYDLKVRFSPTTGGADKIITLPGELRQVRPDEAPITFSGTGILPAGSYKVSVGIIQDSAFGNSFPVKLAQNASNCSKVGANWWCEIGTSIVN